MGYQKTIKITEDKLSAKYLSSSAFTDKEVEVSKLELITYCMQDHTNETNREVIKKIQWLVGLHFEMLRQRCLSEIRERVKKDGEMWFSGWEFSHTSDFDFFETVKNTVEHLVKLTVCVKTPDYFDEDEKFHSKWNEISEEIDAEEIIYDIVGHEFIEEYSGYNEEEDYDDGDDNG